MTIYVLAWGSLIWNPRGLRIAGDWQKCGPVLPLEFSRISNNGRLTLVVDERHGVPISSRYCRSGCASLDEALENLRECEGSPNLKPMGYVDLVSGTSSERAQREHPKTLATISAWALKKGGDAVIWTALGPKFLKGVQFSPEAALRYLEDLKEPSRSMAFEYIRRAPEEVITPVRKLSAHLITA